MFNSRIKEYQDCTKSYGWLDIIVITIIVQYSVSGIFIVIMHVHMIHCIAYMTILLTILLFAGQYGLAINNIPKTISSTYLESDLMKADVQVDVTILCDVNSPTNHGYINCSTEDAAMRIRDKLNGAVMGGHRLSVRLNPKKRSYCQKPDRIVHRPTRGSPGHSVKLSNIPFNVTEMGFSLLGSNEKGFIRAKYIHSSPLAHGFLVFDSRENAKRAFDNLTELGYKASLL